jgi:hypothetical protein
MFVHVIAYFLISINLGEQVGTIIRLVLRFFGVISGTVFLITLGVQGSIIFLGIIRSICEGWYIGEDLVDDGV